MLDRRPAPRRVVSLDVLRGLAVAGMIVVNNPGDWTAVYPRSCTPTGRALPSPILFSRHLSSPWASRCRLRWQPRRAAFSTGAIYKHIGRRVVLLIAIGLALNVVSAWPEVSPLRLPGVLQRIALAYLFASVVVLHVRPSRWLLVAAGSCWLSTGLSWYSCRLAITRPARSHPTTISPRFIDTLVFGRHALTIPIDSEGVLGSWTASATAVFGAVAGELDPARTKAARPLRGLVTGGAARSASG